MVGTTSRAVTVLSVPPRIRVVMFLPSISQVRWTRPLDSSLQLEGVVVAAATNWIISLVLRLIVNGKNGLRALIPDPRREWTMREFVCEVGVVLAIRKVRDSKTKDGSNCHVLPVIF